MSRTLTKFKDFIRHDPRRSPRWRYDRVRRLADGTVINGERVPSKPVRNRDDADVRKALAFILEWERELRGARTEREREEAKLTLHAYQPGLYYAYDLFTANDGDRHRCEIEARLLARQSNEEICEHISSLPESIDWYERLFFNVRDRLNNSGYITNRIIIPSVLYDWENLDLNMTAKFFGYFAGPVVLNAILKKFDQNQTLPGPSDSIDRFFDSHWQTNFKRRNAEVVNFFEYNKFNLVELFAIHTRLVEIAQKAREEEGELSALEAGVSILLQTIGFSSGDARKNALEVSPLKPYYGLPAELRADEMLRISAGEVPESVADLHTLKLPPPSEKTSNGQVPEQGS